MKAKQKASKIKFIVSDDEFPAVHLSGVQSNISGYLRLSGFFSW